MANAVFGEFVTATRTPVVLGEDAPVSLITFADGLELSYEADLGRVRIAVGDVHASAVTAVVDRSTDGIRWTTVRGGELAVTGGGDLLLYDYEFPTGVPLTYRVRTYS